MLCPKNLKTFRRLALCDTFNAPNTTRHSRDLTALSPGQFFNRWGVRPYANATFRKTTTYPRVMIPVPWGADVEVCLISVLGHGAGTQLFETTSKKQASHEEFKDALEEPSSKIGSTNFAKNDKTALYTFTVDQGHPIHRHQGHRVVTAIAGSKGALLRFSPVTLEEIKEDPSLIMTNMNEIRIPADGLFTMRFDGRVWHQFGPSIQGTHPAFFAISTHTDESGGDLEAELKANVLNNEADIASLTELLPQNVIDYMKQNANAPFKRHVLSIDHFAPSKKQEFLCGAVRGTSGTVRRYWTRLVERSAWETTSAAAMIASERKGERFRVFEQSPPQDSLVYEQLPDKRTDHIDCFSLTLSEEESAPVAGMHTAVIMEALLEGFLENPPLRAGRIMAFRNVVVAPLRLRTSPLCCPVSSLISKKNKNMFAERFPVHDNRVTPLFTEVVLGADDKHVQFRTVIGVRRIHKSPSGKNDTIQITMATKVHFLNWFGWFYWKSIERTHKNLITPSLLQHATHHALAIYK